jgi:hypothetical protein
VDVCGFDLHWLQVTSFYAVNGQYQPYIEVVDGAVALLRVLHAVGTRVAVLKLDQPERCTIRLIARDGIFQQGSYLDLSMIALIQATRVDLAVQCTLPAGVDSAEVNVFSDESESVCTGIALMCDLMWCAACVCVTHWRVALCIRVVPPSVRPLPPARSLACTPCSV